jgi:hypothetical protein
MPKSFGLDLYRLAILISVFMAGELLNILMGAIVPGEYLNYNSIKSLIAFPSFYFISKRKFLIGYFLVAITFIILLYYVSRIILIIYFIAIFIHFIQNKKGGISINNMIFMITAVILLVIFRDNLTSFTYFKFGAMINNIIQGENLDIIFQSIDPVRFAEMKIFLDRNLSEIILGSGFGVGLNDANNYLGFIKLQGLTTAFTESEIESGIYFNFHDLWIDIGLRFGLLLLAICIWTIAKLMIKQNNNVYPLAQLLFLLIFSAFFSTAGLILISIIALSLRRSLLMVNNDLKNV